MKRMGYLFIIAVMFLGAEHSHAATKYVSDTLYIPLKTSHENGGRVIRHLKSGTALSIVDSEGKDFVKVKLKGDEGTEGWVKKRYLLDKPIAKSQLARLEDKLERMKSQQGPLRESVKDLKSKLKLALAENRQLRQKSDQISHEISEIKELSSGTIDLNAQNKKLKQERTELKLNVDALMQENVRLKSNQRNEGIKLGLFAMCIGGLAGFILPFVNVRPRRQRGVRLR